MGYHLAVMLPPYRKTGLSTRWAAPTRYLAAAVLALTFSPPMRGAEPVLVDVVLPPHFDPYLEAAQAQYDAAATAACRAPKPAGFLGYRWRLPAFASELRSMTSASVGKQIYIGFLKSKYGYQIAQLNRVYGLDAQSFTELQESPIVVVRMNETVHRDDDEFDAEARREVAASILAALRKCDPAHADAALRLLLDGLLH